MPSTRSNFALSAELVKLKWCCAFQLKKMSSEEKISFLKSHNVEENQYVSSKTPAGVFLQPLDWLTDSLIRSCPHAKLQKAIDDETLKKFEEELKKGPAGSRKGGGNGQGRMGESASQSKGRKKEPGSNKGSTCL